MHQFKTDTELSSTQSNANVFTEATFSRTPDENKEKVEHEKFGKTSIWIRGNAKMGWMATVGNYRVTENFENKDHLLEYLNFPDLYLIMNVVSNMIETAFIMYTGKPLELHENIQKEMEEILNKNDVDNKSHS